MNVPKVNIRTPEGEFDKAIRAITHPIATAATAAISDAGNQVKLKGRARIAAAGFSKKWQNALRVNIFPQRGVSVDAAAWVFHKIPYAGVFEEGAKISGKPMLWIPFPNVATRIGGQKMTPRLFVQRIGPLHSIKSHGKPPILASYISAGADTKKLTTAKLRAGVRRKNSKGSKAVKSVPVFFGVSTVTLRARFGLQEVFREARQALKGFYDTHLIDNR
jgi:hypothetical protein